MVCQNRIKVIKADLAMSSGVQNIAPLNGNKFDKAFVSFFQGHLSSYISTVDQAYRLISENFSTHQTQEEGLAFHALDVETRESFENLQSAIRQLRKLESVDAALKCVRLEREKATQNKKVLHRAVRDMLDIFELNLQAKRYELAGVPRREFTPEDSDKCVSKTFWPNGAASITETEVLAVFHKPSGMYIPVCASDYEYFVKGYGLTKMGKDTPRWWIPRLNAGASGDEIREYALKYGDVLAQFQIGVDMFSYGGDYGHNGRMAYQLKRRYGSAIDRYQAEVKKISDIFDRVFKEKFGYSFEQNGRGERYNYFTVNGKKFYAGTGRATPYDFIEYGLAGMPMNPTINTVRLDTWLDEVHTANFETIYGDLSEKEKQEKMEAWENTSLKERIAFLVNPEAADALEKLIVFNPE